MCWVDTLSEAMARWCTCVDMLFELPLHFVMDSL